MTAVTPVVTTLDRDRLADLLAGGAAAVHGGHAGLLDRQLRHATLVTPAEVPPQVVTMRSRVVVTRLSNGVAMPLTLAYPDECVAFGETLSVLSSLGLRLLGCRVGDQIDWPTPGGVRRLKVDQIVYQPEAAGHFHL